jgi:hypothetical protein
MRVRWEERESGVKVLSNTEEGGGGGMTIDPRNEGEWVLNKVWIGREEKQRDSNNTIVQRPGQIDLRNRPGVARANCLSQYHVWISWTREAAGGGGGRRERGNEVGKWEKHQRR